MRCKEHRHRACQGGGARRGGHPAAPAGRRPRTECVGFARRIPRHRDCRWPEAEDGPGEPRRDSRRRALPVGRNFWNPVLVRCTRVSSPRSQRGGAWAHSGGVSECSSPGGRGCQRRTERRWPPDRRSAGKTPRPPECAHAPPRPRPPECAHAPPRPRPPECAHAPPRPRPPECAHRSPLARNQGMTSGPAAPAWWDPIPPAARDALPSTSQRER